MRRLAVFLPLLVFAGLAVAFAVGLSRDPSVLPSALIDQPVPAFDLPGIAGLETPGLASADLAMGEPVLLNIFASWCVPCRVEHPVLEDLARQPGVTIHALNYKDSADNARRFLDSLGNPFTRIGADEAGRVAIDFGVYGVPETYIIRGDGRIAYRHVGPLRPGDVKKTILPLLERLRAEQQAAAQGTAS
ncbi:MAG: DsbE family thiol:disulfide interchange protein [Pseudomonadota bacterium]